MAAYTLLAMAPSGDALVMRDDVGRTWAVLPEGAGGPFEIDEAKAARAVADHGFDWVDRTFPTLAALQEFTDQRASLVVPDVVVDRESLDPDDVREMLEEADEWVADGDGARARRLALALLRVPAVLGDLALHDRILSFLERLEPARVVHFPVSEPSSNEALRARARYAGAPRAA